MVTSARQSARQITPHRRSRPRGVFHGVVDEVAEQDAQIARVADEGGGFRGRDAEIDRPALGEGDMVGDRGQDDAARGQHSTRWSGVGGGIVTGDAEQLLDQLRGALDALPQIVRSPIAVVPPG